MDAELDWRDLPVTPGLPDHLFDRGQAPMTKREVRAVTMAFLDLRRDSTLIDVGAGSGSVSVEAALAASRGRVFAVEKEEAALQVLRANCRRFNLGNVVIVPGKAPDALAPLPRVERVFIGGSGPALESILEVCHGKLQPGGELVLNAVTLQTATLAWEWCCSRGYQVEGSQLAVTRLEPAGGKAMFRAFNPVFVIAARKER